MSTIVVGKIWIILDKLRSGFNSRVELVSKVEVRMVYLNFFLTQAEFEFITKLNYKFKIGSFSC